MKIIYALAALIVLLSPGCGEPTSSVAIEKDRRDYVLKIIQNECKVVSAADYNLKPEADSVYALISFKLINRTMARLSYMDMSCSGSEIYTTDNNKVRIVSLPCEKNAPAVYEAPANSAAGRDILIAFKKADAQQKFKIGMTLHAQAEDFGNTGIDHLLADTAALIWSTPTLTPQP